MVLFQSSRITGPVKIMEIMLQVASSYFTGPSEVAGREGRRMGGERVSNRDIHASKKKSKCRAAGAWTGQNDFGVQTVQISWFMRGTFNN